MSLKDMNPTLWFRSVSNCTMGFLASTNSTADLCFHASIIDVLFFLRWPFSFDNRSDVVNMHSVSFWLPRTPLPPASPPSRASNDGTINCHIASDKPEWWVFLQKCVCVCVCVCFCVSVCVCLRVWGEGVYLCVHWRERETEWENERERKRKRGREREGQYKQV